MYGLELMEVGTEKEMAMATKSRGQELKKPELTLKERRALKREKAMQDNVIQRKRADR